MRFGAHFAIALGLAAANAAAAQTVVPDQTPEITHAALRDAAFAPTSAVLFWQAGPDRFDGMLRRSWPKAVTFRSDGLEFDIAPHAGFGVGRFGTQAEGGATLIVSKSRGERALEQLRDLGVKDGTSFGDKGRWYLFAAASGRAVGLNMLRGENGWDRAGWSTDASGALVGDAQVGVGWRKGDIQSSFGVIHREVKGRHMVWGQQTRDDTVAAFTFSLRPQN